MNKTSKFTTTDYKVFLKSTEAVNFLCGNQQ